MTNLADIRSHPKYRDRSRPPIDEDDPLREMKEMKRYHEDREKGLIENPLEELEKKSAAINPSAKGQV